MDALEFNDPRTAFRIEPGRAFLCLERDGLLEADATELSPLRRLLHANALPVIWDSRDLPADFRENPAPPQRPRFLYVARAGSRFDGHALAEDVLSSGNVFVGQIARVEAQLRAAGRPAQWIAEIRAHPFFIAVHEPERALRHLLRRASGLDETQFTAVAVTGTNGKTSFVQIAGTLLETLSQRPTLKMGTLGIQFGGKTKPGSHPTMPDFPTFLTALAGLKAAGGDQLCMEATSHGLVQERLGDWSVDVAVFTNLTQDHLDFHGNMERYRDAKALLFQKHLKHGGTAVINASSSDSAFFSAAAKGPQTALLGYGAPDGASAFLKRHQGDFASVRYLEIRQDAHPSRGVQGRWRLVSEAGTAQEAGIACKLMGDFQLENLGAAVAAMIALGYPLAQIARAVGKVEGIPGRLEPVFLAGSARRLPQATVLVDYAHTPDALKRALESCRKLVQPNGKLVCVFGCGGDRDPGKRPAMGEIASALADWTIITSDNPRSEDPLLIIKHIVAGTRLAARISQEADRAKAIELALAASSEGDVVLIAGKGHETEQIVGNERIPFSDALVARGALQRRHHANPTSPRKES